MMPPITLRVDGCRWELTQREFLAVQLLADYPLRPDNVERAVQEVRR